MNGRCDCPAEAGSSTCERSIEPRRELCPGCGGRGKAVDTLTLKALLAVPLMDLRPVDYFFCRTADCPIVYFSADGQQRFAEDSLRELVHQKHLGDEAVFVCYCFRHTPGSIRAALSQTGRMSVVEAIKAGIRAGKCACDIRNPQGSCCLGNVQSVANTVTGVRE